MQSIRTMSLLSVQIKITYENNLPLYKKLAPKIRELKFLNLTHTEIAYKLKIGLKTVKRSIKFTEKTSKLNRIVKKF